MKNLGIFKVVDSIEDSRSINKKKKPDVLHL